MVSKINENVTRSSPSIGLLLGGLFSSSNQLNQRIWQTFSSNWLSIHNNHYH